MTRIGYIVFSIIALALCIYVFWPDAPSVDTNERLWNGANQFPTHYRLQLNDTIQEVEALAALPTCVQVVHNAGCCAPPVAKPKSVTGGRVTINGVVRSLDPDRHEQVWQCIKDIAAAKERIVHAVEENALKGYGIDDQRRVDCDVLILRWAHSADGGYIWDGHSRRLFAVSKNYVTALDRVCDRLDRRGLCDEPLRLQTVVIGGTLLARDRDGLWRDQSNSVRPSFDQRIRALQSLLSASHLDNFKSVPPDHLKEVGTISVTTADGKAHRVVVSSADGHAWVRVDALPIQSQDELALALWNQCFDDLRHDLLFDIEALANTAPLAEVQVSRGKQSLFRLERHGNSGESEHPGQSRWDVVWPTGRETALSDMVARLALMSDHLRVDGAVPRGPTQEPDDAIVYDFIGNDRTSHCRVVLIPHADGSGEVWSATHRGRAAVLPKELTQPSIDACLNTALSERSVQRVIKIQRQDEASKLAEVYVRDAGRGSWRQTFPRSASSMMINQLAVERLVRSLCTARGISARLITSDDREILEHPQMSMALRFAPTFQRQSKDSVRLEDTVDQDWMVSCGRDAQGWRAVDRDGGVSWHIADELIELLRLPVSEEMAFPLVASQVKSIDVTGPHGHFRLRESAGTWSVTIYAADGSNKQVPADAVEVRRYIRLLSGLRSLGPAGIEKISADQALGSVSCELPDIGDERAQAVVTIGRAVGDRAPLAAASSRADQYVGNRVVWINAADAAALLPLPAAFLPAEIKP